MEQGWDDTTTVVQKKLLRQAYETNGSNIGHRIPRESREASQRNSRGHISLNKARVSPREIKLASSGVSQVEAVSKSQRQPRKESEGSKRSRVSRNERLNPDSSEEK